MALVSLPFRAGSPEHFGLIVEAMAGQPVYQGYTLADVRRLVVPPVRLGQYRIWVDEETRRFAAFATWAWTDAAGWRRLCAEDERFQVGDWRSGMIPVVMDLVAPGRAVAVVARDLQAMFGDVEVRWTRSRIDGRRTDTHHAKGRAA